MFLAAIVGDIGEGVGHIGCNYGRGHPHACYKMHMGHNYHCASSTCTQMLIYIQEKAPAMSPVPRRHMRHVSLQLPFLHHKKCMDKFCGGHQRIQPLWVVRIIAKQAYGKEGPKRLLNFEGVAPEARLPRWDVLHPTYCGARSNRLHHLGKRKLANNMSQ